MSALTPSRREAAGRQTAPKPLRCAIYTRKSTEHGLEQEFNSLDNQREAAEAYIKSQAHEGWRLAPGAYDDGGFSGGTLERPALQRLLAEVRAGRVDIIVVYKVDRLTRSLSNFAKLVDLFDAHDVSFVSMTQAFNTTTSMGRLTLNVLLSFAQFEREVTGERIRDKVAASKRKGLRVGGPVPLGYAVENKKLVPEPNEAATVQLIFERYLELASLGALIDDLRTRGIVTKTSQLRDGSVRGGIPFERGALAALLKNRAYIGEVVHKGRYYPGEHPAIIEPALFEAVQAGLASRARNSGTQRVTGNAALLRGLLHDDSGRPMLPTLAKKNGARYRYYASSIGGRGRRSDDLPIARVPAQDVEAVVLQALRLKPATLPPQGPAESAALGSSDLAVEISQSVERITLKPDTLVLHLRTEDDEHATSLIVPWTRTVHRRRKLVVPAKDDRVQRPIRAETRARLLSGIANGRLWLDELMTGRVADTAALAERQGCSERSIRMTLNLAFLAPEVVQAAVDGTLPDGLGTAAMSDMPPLWASQRLALI